MNAGENKLITTRHKRGVKVMRERLSKARSFTFPTTFSTEDEALAYLAQVLVEAYLKQRKYEHNK